MKIGLLSPYHGGSHKAWADGLMRNSAHDFTLFALPDRFWKWRMLGGAVTLAKQFLASEERFDLLLATDMLDLTTFLALTRKKTAGQAFGHIPTLLYMHENQLTYPLPSNKKTGPMRHQGGKRDQQLVFINFASMLAADHVFFNSQFHRDSLLAALPNYLKQYPEHNELNSVEEIREKSEVLPVGVNLQRLDLGEALNHPSLISDPQSPANQLPLILWNQRWEYDKNPEAFLAALYQLADEGVVFRVALCGPFFGKRPFLHDEAQQRLGDRIIHLGYADANHYKELLWEADITLSTAHHEFFGISIIEAIYAETFPILPNRLSYPEIIPTGFHTSCLYENEEGMLAKLRWALANVEDLRPFVEGLKTAVSGYDWSFQVSDYDQKLGKLST
ncbi:MAG: DUF3524 domain-containing protein [Chloroflexota bacterium]